MNDEHAPQTIEGSNELPRAPMCSPCADNDDGRCCGTGECWLCPLNKIDADSGVNFQNRVAPWMMSCFGSEVSRDRTERSHRFLEEALELVQAATCTASEAHQLVDYVFSRPVGELSQEVGGVMVTLAALCLEQGVDMHVAGETELARVWTKIDVIRAKHAAKPKHSPLPGASDSARATLPDAFWEALQRLIENAITQGPASMDDAMLVGRYRDALAMLAAPAVARPAPRAPLPLMHQAFRTTETMGVPECIYRMIFGFPSLAALQAAEAEWIALDRAARALTQGDVSASAAEVKASANLVRSAACNWGSDDPETKRRSASLEIAIDRLAALAGAQAPGAMKWQPIETAPKDGREVLLAVSLRAGISGKSLVGHYMEGGHCIEDHPPIDAGWYFWNGHQFDRAAKPTHWMALPATPGADQ